MVPLERRPQIRQAATYYEQQAAESDDKNIVPRASPDKYKLLEHAATARSIADQIERED